MTAMQRYAYYPGCSLMSSAKEYDRSVRAVFAHLGIELEALKDWNCCGAVHGDIRSAEAAVTLAARNLALAEVQGFDHIITPCSGCYRNLRRASRRVARNQATRELVNAELRDGLVLTQHIEILHPLYVLLQDYGLARIAELIANPLSGLRVASYYGCMLTRPKDRFDSPERPTGLDQLLCTLGAEAVDTPLKARCCGGALAISHSEVTARLTGAILLAAKEAGADMVALACPMCHTALDGYQAKAERAVGHALGLPVLYFTQVLGLALGLSPASLGFERHMVSPRPQLSRRGF